MDLYANVRPLRGGAIDAVVIRENTEGLYAGRERWEREGEMAIAERVITRSRDGTDRAFRLRTGAVAGG